MSKAQVGSEPGDFPLLTAFLLPFVAQVIEEMGNLPVVSGVLLFQRERFLPRGTCWCLWDKGLFIGATSVVSLGSLQQVPMFRQGS